ncbi:hypothetical protein SK854_40060 [Lentzea sp. BCCO 10_0061]|uniref:PknH-like extracellular domain-containing protein n=1 Tax=Lentzea sokolovensis TaxID=3095429 RepID=A0ABU4VA79_9PSEU|nr:hypothetical protein [Lentzea sp. BCCO 10_0061]MDX8148365.1 hypothetical protein [Lentzea sp. BCCO 10_0061]
MRHAITLVCAGLLAACSPAPAEPSASTSAPTTTSTASTPDLVKAMDVKVKAALMPPETFDDIGGRFESDKPKLTAEPTVSKGDLSRVCEGAKIDSGVSTSRVRVFTGPVIIDQIVFGLVGVDAQHVLGTVRDKARSCRTWVDEIGKPEREVKADVDLPELEGVEGSYAFCSSFTLISSPVWSCEAFLVRGDLVVGLRVVAGEEATARRHLPEAVRRGAKTLSEVG